MIGKGDALRVPKFLIWNSDCVLVLRCVFMIGKWNSAILPGPASWSGENWITNLKKGRWSETQALEIFGTNKIHHLWEWLSEDLERILEKIQPISKIYGVIWQSSISMTSHEIFCIPASIVSSSSTWLFFSWVTTIMPLSSILTCSSLHQHFLEWKTLYLGKKKKKFLIKYIEKYWVKQS